MKSTLIALAVIMTTVVASGGVLDQAWIKGVTDKDPISYKSGENLA